MIESIFQLKWGVSRHQQAPLLKEREQFLAHCQRQGTSHKALHDMAPELIAVIRLFRMEELCEVGQLLHLRCEKWLRLHGKLKMPSPPRARFCE
jgi:hypothetical protein